MPVELQTRVSLFALDSQPVITRRIYQALVKAPSEKIAHYSLADYLSSEFMGQDTKINDRLIQGYSFQFLGISSPPKSVLQWFMDLILGTGSQDREYIYQVEIHLQRKAKAKA